MVLSPNAAVDQAKQLVAMRDDEADKLDTIREYVRGEQPFEWLPQGVPAEVRKIAEMARVNVLRYVLNAPTQALYVDGFRSSGSGVLDDDDADDEPPADPVWDIWRANRQKARQVGLHRSTLTYGAAYNVVLPGEPTVSIRGVSPRRMLAVYGSDPDWPLWGLESVRTGKGKMFWLYDDEARYRVGTDDYGQLHWIETEMHEAGVVPIVRYLATDDLDGAITGVVEPLTPLQDQINLTTFSLLVAQHYGAHRQRYVIGWLADSEEQSRKAAASYLWQFDDGPDDIKVGEFEQTELSGYIESREASLRHVATISQTPVHELLGSIANLSADALVAARDSHERALEEWRTLFGESHEQTLELAGQLAGINVDGWVRWRDVGGRSLAQTADALGKFVQMLGIPAEAMWERAADAMGASQDEVKAWRDLAREGSDITQLATLLDRQMSGGAGGGFGG